MRRSRGPDARGGRLGDAARTLPPLCLQLSMRGLGKPLHDEKGSVRAVSVRVVRADILSLKLSSPRARPSRPTGRRTSSATTASSTPSTRCSCPAPTTARGKRDARCRRGGLPPGRRFGGASRAPMFKGSLSSFLFAFWAVPCERRQAVDSRGVFGPYLVCIVG